MRRTLVLVAAQPRTAQGEVFPSQAWIEDEAEPLTGPIGARVVVFSAPPLLEPVADSNDATSLDIASDTLVARAARTTAVVSGVVTRGGATYAETVVSLGAGQPVLLLSTPLNSELEAVAVVRRRVIVAGILATLVRNRARLRARDALRATNPPARASGGTHRGRPLRRDRDRRGPGRARPARAGIRADASASRFARPRAQRVHCKRLSRAPHPALFAGGIPRAPDRRRRRRSGDPGGLPQGDG